LEDREGDDEGINKFGLIAQNMEAVSICETSDNFHQTTRRNIPEDGHLTFKA
jgi:hypothetical protein